MGMLINSEIGHFLTVNLCHLLIMERWIACEERKCFNVKYKVIRLGWSGSSLKGIYMIFLSTNYSPTSLYTGGEYMFALRPLVRHSVSQFASQSVCLSIR